MGRKLLFSGSPHGTSTKGGIRNIKARFLASEQYDMCHKMFKVSRELLVCFCLDWVCFCGRQLTSVNSSVLNFLQDLFLQLIKWHAQQKKKLQWSFMQWYFITFTRECSPDCLQERFEIICIEVVVLNQKAHYVLQLEG